MNRRVGGGVGEGEFVVVVAAISRPHIKINFFQDNKFNAD